MARQPIDAKAEQTREAIQHRRGIIEREYAIRFCEHCDSPDVCHGPGRYDVSCQRRPSRGNPQ